MLIVANYSEKTNFVVDYAVVRDPAYKHSRRAIEVYFKHPQLVFLFILFAKTEVK